MLLTTNITRWLSRAAISLVVACSAPEPAERTNERLSEASARPRPESREAASSTNDRVEPGAPDVASPSAAAPEPIYVLGPMRTGPSTGLSPLRSATRPRASPVRQHGLVSSVTLEPVGVVFDIPYELLGEQSYAGAQLSQVRECETREWQYEYARVANAALPFEALAVHIGAERFCDGVSFAGVQVRAYVLDSSVQQVVEVIRRNAGAEIASLPRAMGPAEPDDPPGRWTPRRTFPDWVTLLARYELHYGDYGGRANMDFHVRRFSEHTVVILLMYVHPSVANFVSDFWPAWA